MKPLTARETFGEIWKPVKNYEDRYEVSNLARIRNYKTLKILKPHMNRQHNGYLKVLLYHEENTPRTKNYTVHSLVATAFIGPCPHGSEIDHIDQVKTNNMPTNLRYITHLENCQRARKRASVWVAPEMNQRNGVIPKAQDIEEIIQVVATCFDLKIDLFAKNEKWEPLAKARQIVCYIARIDLQMKYTEIARRLNRDHSTCIHAVNTIINQIELYDDLAKLVTWIRVELGFQVTHNLSTYPHPSHA